MLLDYRLRHCQFSYMYDDLLIRAVRIMATWLFIDKFLWLKKMKSLSDLIIVFINESSYGVERIIFVKRFARCAFIYN